MSKEKIGVWGEKTAQNYLKKSGFKILKLNYASFGKKQLGEIDIIAEKNSAIYFVEVKTRSCTDFEQILPEEAINRKKLQNMNRVAQIYLKKFQKEAYPYYFCCIAISYNKLRNSFRLKFFDSIFI